MRALKQVVLNDLAAINRDLTEMYSIRYLNKYSIRVNTILIGWQAYRGDQGHRKNSPT